MTTHTLKKHIADLPSGPGIYMFRNDTANNLYIGKASNLKNRLGSYFKTSDTRIKKMVELAHSLKTISTSSEIEALILESQLIKKFRPQFNVVMRDDKQYFHVGFTSEKFPKIFLTHQPKLIKLAYANFISYKLGNSEFIGPFTDGSALKTTLKFFRSVFPYCTCKQLHNNFCLNYHIRKCLGFCCLKKQRSEIMNYELREYEKNISAIKKILSGKKTSLVKDLKKEMALLAKKGNLEKAIELQNKSRKLERIFENARIIKHSEIIKNHRSGLENLLKIRKPIIRIEGYDVSNIQGVHATGSMVSFVNGQAGSEFSGKQSATSSRPENLLPAQPDKNYYRKFNIKTVKGSNDPAMIAEVLRRRFKHHEWPFPDLLLIDGGKGQVNAAIKILKKLAIKIPVIGVSKNEHHIGHQLVIPGRKTPLPLTKLSSADRNLLLQIDSEAHRFAIGYYRKLHRKLFR